MFQTLVQDVRVAGRLLRKSPAFTITAALSLAIGIGSTTAMFSLANALLFKSRPGIADPSRLVDVGRTGHGRGGFDTTSYPNYVDLRDRTAAMRLAAYRVEPVAMSYRDTGEAQRVYVTMASGSYFDVLGTRAAAGRLFRADEDDRARQQPSIVLSAALWERLYRRDTRIIGRNIVLNGVSTTIVGVAEPGFRGTNFMAPDAWVPVGMFPVFNPGSDTMLTNRRAVWLLLIGRLNGGVSIGQAQAQVSTLAKQLEQSYPDSNRDMSWRVAPSSFLPGFFQAPVTAFLALLMAIVGLVLLIACVNLAGVLLARGTARRRELAVRVAIGASRWRIVRQLMTETLVVFAIGCGAGLLLALWIIDALAAIPAALPVPVALDLTLDGRVLFFAIAVALVSGILSGLAPALPASRPNVVSGLKDDGGSRVVRRMRARSVLLVAQVALSCLLLVVAALVSRSLQRAGSVDPGFDARHVDLVSLDFSMGGYRGERALAFARDLMARTSRLPGVTDVALSRVTPLTGDGMGLGTVAPPGRDLDREAIDADWNVVSPGYFHALRIARVAGRDFSDADREGTPPVAIVNETFARRMRADGNVVGERLARRIPGATSELQIVGVVKDGKYRFLGEAPRPFIWVPFAQQQMDRMDLLIRTANSTTPGSSFAAIGLVRQVVHDRDPNLPIIKAQRLSEAVSIALIPQRLAAALGAGLGLVGLLLATVGIYGVTAFSVVQRTREIGVRLALGADRSEVVRLVVRQGLRLALAGTLAGLVMGAAAARMMSSLLFASSSIDVTAFLAVTAVLLSASGLASYLPARIASRIDPLRALRVE